MTRNPRKIWQDITVFLFTFLTASASLAQLATGNPRGGDAVIPVLDQGSYAYVPSIMADGVYKIWYCSTPSAGDRIYYSESNSLDSGWSSPIIVFNPRFSSPNVGGTPNGSDFDRGHTCDPSVIRVNGTYYMYYGGNWALYEGPGRGAIGVASSPDGKSWTRMNNGQAIIRPKNEVDGLYGAGQPSAFYHAGMFYILYTDTSTNYPNVLTDTNNVYALRSTDPTFQTNVQELQGPGNWVPISGAPARTYSPWPGRASLDWRYDDMLNAVGFAIPNANCPNCFNIITMVYQDLNTMGWVAQFDIPGHWTEGSGIVHRPDGHAPPAYGSTYACGTVPVDIVRSVGTPGDPATFRLSHTGLDYFTNCDRSRNGSVFEGSLINGPGLPVMLVRENLRLQLAVGATAMQFAHAGYSVSLYDDYVAVPYGASLYYANDAIYAPGLPGAFRTDSAWSGVYRHWAVSCAEAVSANGSSLRLVDANYWYTAGIRSPDLYCVK